jgi:asparagine synthase (glutamine-hydrolysing)
MCGICGKIEFCDKVPDKALLESMCKTLEHRGPDDQGVYVAPHIGLGQRRLTIIDLEKTACPPLTNEDKSIWLVFNGEIYNYQSIREKLVTQGHRFQTNSDTEVLIHLYEEKGFACLQELRGMFAFALWDQQKKLLFCARDPFGKKPFCYCKTTNGFIFASEIKAITVNPEVKSEPDFSAIDLFLTYSYIPSPETAFKGIKKLKPGHFLTCDVSGRVTINQYWSPTFPPTSDLPELELKSEISNRLQESVKMRMISDVPLGAFLSGGIDSATIVAMMAKQSTKKIKTFSIGFEEDQFNELPFARLVAEKYETEHHEFIVKPEAAEILPLLVKFYNEPFADSSAIPSYYVAKMTKNHVSVALTGDGGDETFGGYDNYASILSWNKCDILPWQIRNLLARMGSGLLSHSQSNFAARAIRALQMFSAQSIKDRKNLFATTLKKQEKDQTYSDCFTDLIEKNKTQNPVINYPYNGEENLEWLMKHDQNFYLPDCLMVKMDIASMANSLEARSPFLDHEFVDFAATVPARYKRMGNAGKIILKSVAKDLLPSELLNKPKTGFSIPLARWLRNELAETMKEALLGAKFSKRGLFNFKSIDRMVNEHLTEKRDWSNRLWSFIFLEHWFQEFID